MPQVNARRSMMMVALVGVIALAIGGTAYSVGDVKRSEAAPAIPLDGDFFYAKCWEIQHLEQKLTEATGLLQRTKGDGIDKARDELARLRMQRNIEIGRYNLEAKRAPDKHVLSDKGLPLQLNDGAQTTTCQQ